MHQVAELGELEDLSGKELLDRVDMLHSQQLRTDLLILQAAYQHANLNNEETIDPKRTAFGTGIKTFGGWEVKQPLPGIFLWRDRYGATCLVDHSGTRRIGLTMDLFFDATAVKYAA